MQFKIGDTVIHATFGIGHIRNIEEKEFSEKKVHLYYKVSLSKRTVWIPVEAQGIGGLRLVTDRSDLDQYRQLLKSPPVLLEQKHHQRHLELIHRLKQGSFQVLCEVVRDLTAWSWRRPLGPTDSTTLQKVQNDLYQEWALAAGISPLEASKEIDALLLSNRSTYLGLM